MTAQELANIMPIGSIEVWPTANGFQVTIDRFSDEDWQAIETVDISSDQASTREEAKDAVAERAMKLLGGSAIRGEGIIDDMEKWHVLA